MNSSITSWLLLPLLLFWLNVGVDCLDAKTHDSVRQTETPVALIQRSSSTSEAASLLRQHHDMKFIIENLEKHGLSFEQILIDLHHSEGKRILTSKASGKCRPSSWQYMASCMGKNSACKPDPRFPCKGLCRCNTMGIDECECVKSLKEPMKEDDTHFFMKTVDVASNDMKNAGKKIIEKADKAVDAIGDKFTEVIKKGMAFIKRDVIDKIKAFLHTFKTASKQSVDVQKEVVKEAKVGYYKAKGKAEKKEALLKLAHEIGKLNGMEQMVAIKTTFKQVLSILKGVGHAVLPDMLIIGANYGSTLSHTAGVEQVYDFRTREIGTFVFGGINLGTNQINALIGKSIGASAGVYLALGWQHSSWCKTLEDNCSLLEKRQD